MSNQPATFVKNASILCNVLGLSQDQVVEKMRPFGGARGPKMASGGGRWYSVEDVIFSCRQLCGQGGNLCKLQPWNYCTDEDFADCEPRDALDTSCLFTHQKRAVQTIFTGDCATSGLIEMECGTGKTLVGVYATHISGAPSLVNMVNTVSVDQWSAAYESVGYNASNLMVVKHAAIGKWDFAHGLPSVVVCTYSLLLGLLKTYEARFMQATPQYEYSTSSDVFSMIFVCMLLHCPLGMHVLDEVHVAPAENWQMVLQVRSKCRIGLSGTLVREDSGIVELTAKMIGPVIFNYHREHIQSVQYVLVKVPDYKSVWWKQQVDCASDTVKKRSLIKVFSASNPYKVRYVTERLLNMPRGEKIIIFCDVHNAICLWHYMLGQELATSTCKLLGPLSGKSTNVERSQVVQEMRSSPETCVVLCSKIFDSSIDIPECRHVFQVGLCTKGRQQEEQRLGRTRRKANSSSFMYTVVTTSEMRHAIPRLQHLKTRYRVQLRQESVKSARSTRCAVLDSAHDVNSAIIQNPTLDEEDESSIESAPLRASDQLLARAEHQEKEYLRTGARNLLDETIGDTSGDTFGDTIVDTVGDIVEEEDDDEDLCTDDFVDQQMRHIPPMNKLQKLGNGLHNKPKSY